MKRSLTQNSVHSQGRRVLLLTRLPVDSIWSSISDLAGAALSSLETTELITAVHEYLHRLYSDMSLVRTWPTLPTPSRESNLLNNLAASYPEFDFQEDGPYGKSLVINSWKKCVDMSLDFNVFPGAKFVIQMRALKPCAVYTIYFHVHFSDKKGTRRNIWLGLNSAYRATGLSYAERTFPAQTITQDWRILSAEFDQLLSRGYILGTNPIDYVEKLRIRAGNIGEESALPIEIGHFSITGIDQ